MGVIFISHSSRNSAEAVEIRDWLRGEGYAESFLDLDPEHGLAPGQRWEEELQKAGERCLAVVVLISPDWCTSKWCFHEFKFAKALGKKIFPVLIHPTRFEDMPLELTSQFQIADVSTIERKGDGLNRLRIGLQRAGLDPKHFTLPEGRAPYRGLKALEEEDAAVFFGRDAQITAGLDTLRQMRGGDPHRILTIAAASGAGKSSFLKAGLLSRLRRDDENFLILPTWRPGRDALGGETGLLKSLGLGAPGSAVAALSARQADVTARLAGYAAAANETWSRSPPSLVLPLDQAEELFSADNTSAAAALDLLVQALAEKPDLLVIATIRSDSLGGLQADARIANQLNLFNLPALPPSAFKEVIEGPAALAVPPIRIEPALSQRLIDDLDRADALPLLAFTLERLVADYGSGNLLELKEYETGLGGVSGAINAAVEAAMRRAEADPSLPNTRHELDTRARAAFIPWLVQLDEADASPKRRVARLTEIPESARPLIRHFVEERLLVASEAGGEPVIEVSHEAVVRHWRGLAAWISEERIVLEGLQRILRSSQEWARNEKTLQARSADLLVHRGERLKAAEAYFARPDMASALQGLPADYLKACRAAEDEVAARDKAQAEREVRQRRRAGRWQAMAAIIVTLGISAVAIGSWLRVAEQRTSSRSKSLILSRAAEQMLQDGDSRRALVLSILAGRETSISPSTPESLATFATISQSFKQRLGLMHEGPVRGAVFSEDEALILSWSDDKTARIWDAANGTQIVPALQHDGAVLGAAISKDGARIITRWWDYSAQTGGALLWDAKTGVQVGSDLGEEVYVNGAIFSNDGTRILTWSDDKTARLWDAHTGAPISPALEHDGDVYSAAFSKDDGRILTSSFDETARLWDAQTGAQIGPAFKHEKQVLGAAFSHDETQILTWSDDNTARIWDPSTGVQIGPPLQHESVEGAAFSGDDQQILTWGSDNAARLWNAATGDQIVTPLEHKDRVYGGAFSIDGKRILTWGLDNTARLWDASTGEPFAEPFQHDASVVSAAFSKDERRILTNSDDKTARLWDVSTGKQIGPAMQHDGPVLAVFSKDESSILTASLGNTARIWDASAASQIGPDLEHSETPRGATFSSDERNILTWEHYGGAKLWDAKTGKQIEPDVPQSAWVDYVVFSPSGAQFLGWSWNARPQIRDAASGAKIGPELQFDDSTVGAVFSADETRILTWSNDGTARLWDAATGAQIGPAFQHKDWVNGAAFSMDETRILTWSNDGTARLWDAATGAQIGPALQHEHWVRSAAFSKDESRIVTLGFDENLRLWEVGTGTQLLKESQEDHLVHGANFSHDGTRLLAWGTDSIAEQGEVRVWNALTGVPIGSAIKFEFEDSVIGAAFSKDDNVFLTWGDDKTARIWDSATGVQIGESLQHDRAVNGAAFSKNESRILTWSKDGTARIWDTATQTQIGPEFRHRGSIEGAVFSRDEKRLLTRSEDGTARLWDVRWAMATSIDASNLAELCDSKLRGSLKLDNKGREVPFPHLIDDKMVAAAPMLRGREGEDVCAVQKPPWWDKPLQTLIDWTGMD